MRENLEGNLLKFKYQLRKINLFYQQCFLEIICLINILGQNVSGIEKPNKFQLIIIFDSDTIFSSILSEENLKKCF